MRERREACGPGSGAVDELRCLDDAGGGVDRDGAGLGLDRQRGSVGAEVNGGGSDCGEKRDGELAWVETVLVEEDEALVAGDERGKEMREILRGEDVVCGGDVRRKGLQGGVGVERNADTGEGMETFDEIGIEREAEVGQRTKLGRIVRVGGGKHTGGSGGGLGEWVAAVEYGDAEAAMVEFEGERETHDAGAGDADVGVMHENSLVWFRRGYSLCQVCCMDGRLPVRGSY
jgi:hypothetical protein